MVSLNLTIFVELGLFLVFLWVMNKVTFRPMLRVMDGRDDKIAQDRQSADADGAGAEALEKQYLTAFRADKRRAQERARQARREARDHYMARVADREKRAEEEVGTVRAAVLAQAEAQRAQYASLVPDLAATVARRLDVGGDDS